MKLGLNLPYEGSLAFPEAVELAQRAEALGFESVWMPEAYGTDAISILGALAARTQRIRLGTGIVNVFSRTPALLAQTAATLDLISGGRFILGLGTSGHQVVSGWHGMAFDQPLLRMRETIAIVRQVLRRDRLIFEGEVFHLDKGLKLLARPVRDTVPIFLATLTPGGLRLTGELADGWISSVPISRRAPRSPAAPSIHSPSPRTYRSALMMTVLARARRSSPGWRSTSAA